MSAKKLTNPAQGIKSFFTPKAENKKPQPDNVVCVDLVDSEPAKGKNTKVNKFFMSQAEKKDLERQETQKRILDEMMRAKQETDSMLVSATKEKNEPTSSFFVARPARPSHVHADSKVCDLSKDAADSAANEHTLQAGFPPMQHVGVEAALKHLAQHRSAISSTSSAPFTPARRPAPEVVQFFEETVAQMPSSDPLSEWGTVHLGRSFTPSRSRVTGSASAGDSGMYPLAQATSNLRALWLQWVLSNASASDGAAQPISPDSVRGHDSVVEATLQVRLLMRWLEKWVGKRRASLSRSSTQSKPVSRSSSRQSSRAAESSASKRAPASARKGGRRGRVLSDSEDSEEEADDGSSGGDASEDEGDEVEWSDGEGELRDSSDDEAQSSRARRSSRASASASACAAPLGAEGGEEDEGETLTNVMVLEGPSGSGKSAAVHDCARKLGIRVIEVSASQQRSGAAVKKFIAEAAQSENIMDNLGNASFGGAQSKEGNAGGISLILFDEVDNVFEEDGDAQLYSAIQQIAGASKCPILLTTERPLPFFKALHAKCVKFSRPSCRTNAAFEELSIAAATAAAAAIATDASHVLAAASVPRGTTAVASIFAPKTTPKPAIPSMSGQLKADGPTLTAKEEQELRVLCALCDGDTRAAVATLQLLPGMFFLKRAANALGQSSTGAVVDLTDSPTACRTRKREKAEEPATRAAPFRSFQDFLREEVELDFALCDGRWQERENVSDAAGPNTGAKWGIRLPVVQEVSPRVGLCSGGFTVVIRGANFLQAGALPSAEGETAAPASVRVLLNGVIPCPCVLKSDACIVAYVPAVEQQGVYIFVVEVEIEVGARLAASARSIVARSDVGGVGSAWIQLLNRSFPPLPPTLTRCSSASSIGVSSAPAALEDHTTPAAQSDSDADTVVDNSQESPSTEGARATARSGGKKKIVLGKRLRKAAKSADDSDDDFELGFDAAEARGPAKRRQRAVHSGSESEEQDRASAASTPVATSQEEEESAMVSPDAAEHDLSALGGMLQAAMRSALTAVMESSLSDPFLEPVSDLVAPGYSAMVKAPMDLGTIQASLDEGLYKQAGEAAQSPDFPDVAAFAEDLRQVWRNCVLYNGASSPLVRTAYVLSFLFESKFRTGLEQAAALSRAMRLESNGSGAIAIKCETPARTLLTVPANDAFESCAKVAKSMSTTKMQTLLAQSGRDAEVEAPVLSVEEALGPERIQEADLCEALRAQRSAKASSGNTRTDVSVACAGLEYELDEASALESFGIALPAPPPADGVRHRAELAALQAFSSARSWACEADVLSACAVQRSEDADEDDPLHCAHRTFLPYGCTAPALHPTATFALASYSRILMRGAILRDACPRHASIGPQSLLGSPYLHCELSRVDFARRVLRAVGSYAGRPNNKGGASMCPGLLGQQTMLSLSFVPRSLAVDIVPKLTAMCRTEKENDEDALAALVTREERSDEQSTKSNNQESLAASRRRTVRLICGSDRIVAATAGARLTRRSLSGTDTPRHQRFTYMKSKLSANNPDVYHNLIDTSSNMLW